MINVSPLPPERQAFYDDLGGSIGDTPLVAVPELSTNVWSKLEYTNPSGSHYDRAYIETLAQLEAEGLIRPGDELRDITSGSAGASLAWLARELGYCARITVPPELPPNRLRDMRAFGAELVTSAAGYVRAASQHQHEEISSHIKSSEWERLKSDDPGMRAIVFKPKRRAGQRAAYINHSENNASPRAFAAIAHELVSQAAEVPEIVALAMGNWTTIAGIVPVLRKEWPQTRIIGYEGTPSTQYENFGTTNNDSPGTDVPLRFRDSSLVDDILTVSAVERDVMDHKINVARTEEAVHIGRSSLMGLVVVERLGSETAITVAYDRANRY